MDPGWTGSRIAANTDGTQAIRRAAAILRRIGQANSRGVGPSTIAEALDLPRSTTHRILKCLVEEGLAHHDMDALSTSSPGERVVLMKAARTGGLEAGLSWLGYIIQNAPGIAMPVMPSLDLGAPEHDRAHRSADRGDPCPARSGLGPEVARRRQQPVSQILPRRPVGDDRREQRRRPVLHTRPIPIPVTPMAGAIRSIWPSSAPPPSGGGARSTWFRRPR